MLNKKSVDDINVKGQRVLVRCDFNVPLIDGKITDENRIVAALPTIKKLIADGGKVILCSHLGKPKGEPKPELSLAPVAVRLAELLGQDVKFAADPEVVGENAKAAVEAMKDGDVVLLENTRYRAEETKNGEAFSKELASLCDVFVNDAFGTAHRAHASTAVIAKFFPSTKFFGLLMAKELEAIDKVLGSGEKPVTAILGGSKVSTKITIIENILPAVDNLIIGGGMSFTFIKALGGNIGTSLLEADKMDLALEILEKAKLNNVKVFLPVDVIAADEFNNDAHREEVDIYHIPENMMGMDAGSKTREIFHDVIMNSRTILWNGPIGVFEMENFSAGTKALGDSIDEATQLGAFSLVGGGDSVAFVKQNGYADKVSYVSTGGGAMLESLEGLELPGVAAINN